MCTVRCRQTIHLRPVRISQDGGGLLAGTGIAFGRITGTNHNAVALGCVESWQRPNEIQIDASTGRLHAPIKEASQLFDDALPETVGWSMVFILAERSAPLSIFFALDNWWVGNVFYRTCLPLKTICSIKQYAAITH